MKYKKYELRLKTLATRETKVDYSFDCASQVARFLIDEIKANTLPNEHGWVIFTNAKGRVIGYEEISKGDITMAPISPRMVFTPALLANAVGVFLAHNHPSGICDPSPEDRALTQRMVEAGKILNVRLLDHVIVGTEPNEYYSFAGNGEI